MITGSAAVSSPGGRQHSSAIPPVVRSPAAALLRRRVGHDDFTAAFTRAQDGGAAVHLDAADVAAVAVAELPFIGSRGFLPLGEGNFRGKLEVQAFVGGDG